MKKAALFTITALFAVSAALTASTPAARAAINPADAELQFLRLANTERVNAGLAPLHLDLRLQPGAEAWSKHMSDTQTLSHNPDLAGLVSSVEPAWQRAGENVGHGTSVAGLHQAFMNSPGHRANVLGDYNRVAVAVTIDSASMIWVTFDFLKGPDINGTTGLETQSVLPTIPVSQAGDFWLATADGHVYSFGNAAFFGDASGVPLVRPIVGMAATPTGNGYWLVASDGGIFAFGDATFFGSTGGVRLVRPIVAMASTALGHGYWLVASDGGIFAFGDARFFGSMGGAVLNQAVNGMAPTTTGQGYWLVASDGGIFSFGDATFLGSTGGQALPAPVTAIATLPPSGGGYWLEGADGSVYPFGSAKSYGSPAATAPLSKIAPMPDGKGYRMAAADGRVYEFGSGGYGVTPPLNASSPVVAMANHP